MKETKSRKRRLLIALLQQLSRENVIPDKARHSDDKDQSYDEEPRDFKMNGKFKVCDLTDLTAHYVENGLHSERLSRIKSERLPSSLRPYSILSLLLPSLPPSLIPSFALFLLPLSFPCSFLSLVSFLPLFLLATNFKLLF